LDTRLIMATTAEASHEAEAGEALAEPADGGR
jgi:hypothetical protein